MWRGNVHFGERLPEQLTKLTKGRQRQGSGFCQFCQFAL